MEVVHVNKPVFKKRSWKRLFKKKNVKPEEFKQPLLFLMKDNGDVEILEGVRSGVFEITSTFNKGENKAINLTANKLLSLNYGGEKIKCWIAYEGEAVSYPLTTVQDSRDQYQIIKRIAMNYKDLKMNSFTGKGTLKIVLLTIAVLLILGTLGMSTGILDGGGTVSAGMPFMG